MEKLLLFYLRHFPLELGKKRIASLLSFNNINGEFVYTTSEGLKFNINMKEYVMKQIYMFDIYETPYVKLLSSFPKNNINNIIDIGANIGNYTISLKKAYPNSRIHSFEPNSTNYRRLTSNIELNNFNNINANKKGLSDK